MEPNNLPTSFIPKRPVSTEDVITRPKNHSVGILSLIATVSVIATIVAFVGVYLYQSSLTAQKTKLQASIKGAKDGLGADFVTDMKRLNSRIEGVKLLIKSHVVVSPIFEALQSTTLRSVQYDTFGYEFATDPGTKAQLVQVKLTGSAKNYATIALQSDAYSQSQLIKNPIFSNLTIDDKTQRVGFNLVFTVTPSDLSYQTFVDGKNKAATPVSTSPSSSGGAGTNLTQL